MKHDSKDVEQGCRFGVDGECSQWREQARKPFNGRSRLSIVVYNALFILTATILTGASYMTAIQPFISTDSYKPPLGVPVHIQRLWASYSPYYPAASYIPPPKGCTITQVNILQRHGARFPRKEDEDGIKTVLKKLKNAKSFKDHRLDFLEDYTYDLSTEDLIPLGKKQSFEAGAQAFERYHSAVNEYSMPFLRASGAGRVVATGQNWINGFAAASHERYKLSLDVVIAESSNNTLNTAMCPNGASPDNQTSAWEHVYARPIVERLNHAAPGAGLTVGDITTLIDLCAFETVAREKKSPFCNLFSKEEFEAYEYNGDLEKFYTNSYGAYLGPVQGVGYVNELISRLTGKPINDHTQTNRTLDSNPETFPLNRTLYVDFTHENLMIASYAVLGLFNDHVLLDPKKPDPKRTFLASRLVPFSARLITERLDCAGQPFVRLLVNDALQEFNAVFCQDTSGKNGMCTLEGFVDSLVYARHDGEGDFEKCYEE